MTNKNNDIQRVTVTSDLSPGPTPKPWQKNCYAQSPKSLFNIGAELTTVRVEIKGHPPAW